MYSILVTVPTFRRYRSVHERKIEWQCRRRPSACPLHPVAVGYSRWRSGALQVRRLQADFGIEVVLAGSLVHVGGGTRWQLAPGDVLLKQVGSRFRLRPVRDGFCHKVHVTFAGSALPAILDGWALSGELAVRCRDVAAARGMVAGLFADVARGLPAERLGAACYAVLQELARGRPRRRRPATLAAAQAFIRRHVDRPLRVAEIADHVGVGSDRLHRLFREHLGRSPIEHLVGLRLERAGELLRAEPGLLIKQVASRCGFDDQRYFARMFRRRYGESPRRWRERSDPRDR